MTQAQTLLNALRNGERLTMLSALQRYQVMACSQRMTDLRAEGHPIQSRMIELPNGKRVAEYWLEAPVQLELIAA